MEPTIQDIICNKSINHLQKAKEGLKLFDHRKRGEIVTATKYIRGNVEFETIKIEPEQKNTKPKEKNPDFTVTLDNSDNNKMIIEVTGSHIYALTESLEVTREKVLALQIEWFLLFKEAQKDKKDINLLFEKSFSPSLLSEDPLDGLSTCSDGTVTHPLSFYLKLETLRRVKRFFKAEISTFPKLCQSCEIPLSAFGLLPSLYYKAPTQELSPLEKNFLLFIFDHIKNAYTKIEEAKHHNNIKCKKCEDILHYELLPFNNIPLDKDKDHLEFYNRIESHQTNHITQNGEEFTNFLIEKILKKSTHKKFKKYKDQSKESIKRRILIINPNYGNLSLGTLNSSRREINMYEWIPSLIPDIKKKILEFLNEHPTPFFNEVIIGTEVPIIFKKSEIPSAVWEYNQ